MKGRSNLENSRERIKARSGSEARPLCSVNFPQRNRLYIRISNTALRKWGPPPQCSLSLKPPPYPPKLLFIFYALFFSFFVFFFFNIYYINIKIKNILFFFFLTFSLQPYFPLSKMDNFLFIFHRPSTHLSNIFFLDKMVIS